MALVKSIRTLRLGEYPNLLWVTLEDGNGQTGPGETFFGPRAAGAHITESRWSHAHIVAPICQGTNSWSPRPCASDFDCSPDATLRIMS